MLCGQRSLFSTAPPGKLRSFLRDTCQSPARHRPHCSLVPIACSSIPFSTRPPPASSFCRLLLLEPRKVVGAGVRLAREGKKLPQAKLRIARKTFRSFWISFFRVFRLLLGSRAASPRFGPNPSKRRVLAQSGAFFWNAFFWFLFVSRFVFRARVSVCADVLLDLAPAGSLSLFPSPGELAALLSWLATVHQSCWMIAFLNL